MRNIFKCEKILVMISSFIISFIFLTNSPLHPWIVGESGTDSSVFKYIALLIKEGYMPYRDTFDHKGPLLYIINFLGNSISTRFGICIIEIIAISITFITIYWIARMSCSINSSIVITGLSSTLLFSFFDGGNLVEEYAMPFIAISTYYFLDYLFSEKISKLRLIISGICFGSVLFLRPNMIAIWIVYCLTIFGYLLFKHKILSLISIIFYFIIGLLIISLPIILWLGINDSLPSFWNAYISFNSIYSDQSFISRWNAFIFFINENPLYLFSTVCMLYKIKHNPLSDIPYLVYMILSVVLISISGTSYSHYGMILTPVASYPLSLIFSQSEKIENTSTSKSICSLLSVIAICIFIIPNWINTISDLPEKYKTRYYNHISETCMTISEIIKDSTLPEEPISVYGNWDYIYILSERKHATLYSYQYPIQYVVPSIMEDYFSQLKNELPRIIVIQGGRYDNYIEAFLTENNYHLKWAETNNTDSIDEALLYTRDTP